MHVCDATETTNPPSSAVSEPRESTDVLLSLLVCFLSAQAGLEVAADGIEFVA